jgi:putative Mg2+ transporter-C (MgtC) family protein
MEPGAFLPVHMSWIDVAARFGGAFVLALALGMERFLHRKPVDFRPFVIISLASCGLTIAIMEVAYRADVDQLSIDPAKVMSGIMSGIGFLGAGALFREKHVVQGAGSASAIWAAGAIGIVCGFGLFWVAGILAIGVVGTLMISRPFTNDYTIRTTDGDTDER